MAVAKILGVDFPESDETNIFTIQVGERSTNHRTNLMIDLNLSEIQGLKERYGVCSCYDLVGKTIFSVYEKRKFIGLIPINMDLR